MNVQPSSYIEVLQNMSDVTNSDAFQYPVEHSKANINDFYISYFYILILFIAMGITFSIDIKFLCIKYGVLFFCVSQLSSQAFLYSLFDMTSFSYSWGERRLQANICALHLRRIKLMFRKLLAY